LPVSLTISRIPTCNIRTASTPTWDWGVSHFVSKQMHLGLVGYYYQQITGDSGSGAIFGDFKSRVAGVGPQVGVIFPVADMQGYLNLKVYKDFAAEHRPEGWNAWLTFAVSPKPPTPTAAVDVARR
jgi:hypothetical protein